VDEFSGGFFMQTKKITRLAAMMLAAAVSAGPMLAQSQADKHVVSLGELSKDAAGPAQTRRANEAEIRQLFATVDGQKALKTANVEYAKIDRAVSSMSDEDVARISDRARAIDHDFAAGNLSDHDLLLILIIALIVIILIVVLR
jgi:hypothetical protein